MIIFKHHGDFSKALKYLNKMERIGIDVLEENARAGLSALASATPVRTDLTAQSWYYEIQQSNTGISITYYNRNVNENVNIALIIQYGHGTRNGGWVEGIDYINPAIQPIFDNIVEQIWGEVTRA